MGAPSKSKIWWFFGLFLRLALVTGTGGLLFFLLPRWMPLRLLAGNNQLWLVGIVLLAGYTWAVRFGLPFFPLRSRRWRLIFSAVLAVILVAASYATFYTALLLFWSSGEGAWFSSPTVPANRILFVDRIGFPYGRDFNLCAKAQGQKTRFVAQLDDGTGNYHFSHAQWTKDGRAVVCSLILLQNHSNESVEPAAVIAYDFSAGQIIVPSWLAFDPQGLEFKESSWREFEPTVQKLAAAHGGLTQDRITDDMVRSKEKLMMFWQIPN